MRRVTGLIATALGTFLIVLALVTRFYVVGQAVKFPLNESIVTTLVGHRVSYFNTGELQELTGVSMTDTTTTQGDVAAGSSSTAVWNSFTYLYDDTNQLTFSYSLRQLAFNRRSAELLNSPAAFIDGKKVHVSGLGYVWPLNAKKQSYEILDRTLNKPELTSYTATATIDGLKTYVYVEQVAPTQFGTQTLPGPLVGLPNEQTVQVGEFYTGTRTDWVDPITGAPVQTQLMEHTYLAATSGTPVLNLLNGTFTTSPSSVSATVAIAKHYDAEIGLISLIIPAIIAIAGVIILLIGLILGRRPRAYYYEAESAQDLAGTAG